MCMRPEGRDSIDVLSQVAPSGRCVEGGVADNAAYHLTSRALRALR